QGRKVVMQLKYHQQGYYEGVKAVEEADEARKNYHADIAIAVTSTSFLKAAKEKAEELDVRCWDGQYLMDIFGWDGTI
ncbi:MAG: restriction endonuclease, partial [Clostridia bacterium]|nr:restriction endonuclease [Clostridia bacterium]